MDRRIEGITLVELLIAGAVLVLLLLSLSQLFSGAFRSYAVTEEVAERRQITQAAVELLRYDLSLSGFRCTDASSGSRTFLSSPFSFTPADGGSPASLIVQYYEDRFVDEVCAGPVAIVFSVDGGALTRSVDGGTPVAVVEGVTDIGVVAWLNRVNSQFVPEQTVPDEALAGVVLRLSFDGGIDEVFTVGFRNSQCANLTACE